MRVTRPTHRIPATDSLRRSFGGEEDLVNCTRWDTWTMVPTARPIPRITVAIKYAIGQPEER
jgi:hypothetical protein